GSYVDLHPRPQVGVFFSEIPLRQQALVEQIGHGTGPVNVERLPVPSRGQRRMEVVEQGHQSSSKSQSVLPQRLNPGCARGADATLLARAHFAGFKIPCAFSHSAQRCGQVEQGWSLGRRPKPWPPDAYTSSSALAPALRRARYICTLFSA